MAEGMTEIQIPMQEKINTGTAWTRNESFDKDGYLVVNDLWDPEELYHPVPEFRGQLNYWDDDPSTGTKKIEVRQKSFENILTNWDGGSGLSSIGAVCFGKNETWFSAKEQLASGTNDVPDYYLFLCLAEAYEGQTNCDVTGGIPQKCNKYLYSIKWSRFGNISLSKFKFDPTNCKEDEVDGEWNEL